MSDNKTENQNQSPRPNASASSLEDDKFVAEALSGNEASYKKLVDKYQKPLYFHIRKMIKEVELVEDLVQEVFMKAFHNLSTYSNEYAFSTWLYRIATNHTIDYLRKKKLKTLSINDPYKTKDGEMEIQLPDETYSTDEPVMKKQRKQIVQDAIQNLPEKYKAVIEMRHMEEKTYQEIADILDLPLGTVKAHIFRARELLYKALKDKKETF
ncbi:RNA polymerase sigma factor [Gracilimonas mengyeensis]|uniref:RNA polymerase sigma factor n=1 Tax=Gracilimonas mengyeensis TaxID=1302730 RepID=A0A521EZA8_9BACT|nr:sigma-70 family RNA polymerase sigma factor [Gracilimonas mengyeensis]SMO89288.1 RNA polymerase sigma-70 factor, ECF subfamily [Gracilimonas mengyeensis]